LSENFPIHSPSPWREAINYYVGLSSGSIPRFTQPIPLAPRNRTAFNLVNPLFWVRGKPLGPPKSLMV
jgi:hypothetical protein